MADGLRRLDGVADVEVDLQQNVCEVTPARDRAPGLAAVPAAVYRAGYRPGRLWVRARGAAVGTNAFRITGFRDDLPVRGEVPGDGTITALVELQPTATLVPTAAVPASSSAR